jgi:hypothetical protein
MVTVQGMCNIKVNVAMIRAKQGRIQAGGGCRPAAPPPTHQIRNLKNTDFVDIMVSQVPRDFPLSRNQPLKLADDRHITILKNKLINKKTRRQDTVTEARNM